MNTDLYAGAEEDVVPMDKPVRLERFVGVMAFTVGLADRAFGGREEGGWWYDTFEPQRVFYVKVTGYIPGTAHPTNKHVREKLERWCERMNREEQRHEPGSVLCEGYWTVVSEAVTKPQPEERPYYS
jgi:hypothetical protein